MITLQDQIFQLVIGLFLGCYHSITYIYFNQFFSSKRSIIKKNIYDFLFIIFNLLLLISFLEKNVHGIIKFYPLCLFIVSFLSVQLFLKDKLIKNFIKVYLLVQFSRKYIIKFFKRLFISKMFVMLLNYTLRVIKWFRKYFLIFKNKGKKDNPI